MGRARRHEVLAGRGVLPLVGAAGNGRRRNRRVDELPAEDRLLAVPDSARPVENASSRRGSREDGDVERTDPANDA